NQAKFELILNDDIEEKTGYYRGYILLRLFNCGNKNQKNIILDKVYDILNNEPYFDFKLYDFFTSEKIIPCEEKYLIKFKNTVKEVFNQDKKKYYSNNNDREIRKVESLNYLINHVYHFYDTAIYKNLKDFENHSDYYDFLINPKEFDFLKIKIHWFYISYRSSSRAIKSIIQIKEINDFS
ncbi:hypothetical protein, partial [Tenacibaculum maritimum]|uniref:hypothetical protein n=1 Tax=Tenacibaculum maritimum TaxID=107401 RepID=UPI0038762B7D